MSAIDALFAANDNKPKRVRDHKARWAKRNAKEPERECERCGTLYRAAPSKGSPRRFCSVECRNANVAAARWLKANSGRVSHTVFRPICELCGKRFTAKTPAQILCSPECGRVYNLERTNAKNRGAAQPKGARLCGECGEAFTPEYGDIRSAFCSNTCCKRHNGRISQGRRNARMRSVANDNVNPFVVFERDGWTCQLCRVGTPRVLRGTHAPNAPELDHINPISKGGGHTYKNTQLLCRSCNGWKSDRVISVNDNAIANENAA